MYKKSRKVDLHLHSNCSDGVLSPTQLVNKISTAGLAAFALTDHDTTSGLKEAEEAANKSGIEFVPGIEISVVERSREYHILGYYPTKLPLLEEKLLELRNQRFLRMEKTIQLLQQLGFKITEADVLAEAGQAAPGRLHLARILLRKNYVHTIEEAFKYYLGFNRTAYVKRETLSLPETVRLLVECQAIPVYAHPGAEGLAVIKTLIPYGLKGVEAFHPDHSNKLVQHVIHLAKEYRLLITGGSDFHGSPDTCAPYPLDRAIDYCYLEKLKTRTL